jgi:hypothetical protein
MQKEIKFYNVNLADLRAMVHTYDLQSLYRAVDALNGASFEKIGVLGELQVDRVKEYVDLEHVSHTIDEFKIVDDMIIGHVRILDTPAGKIAQNSLINDGKLICGFSMASMVDINDDGDCVVDRIVAFHMSLDKPPITRKVDWSAAQPLRDLNRNRGTIPVTASRSSVRGVNFVNNTDFEIDEHFTNIIPSAILNQFFGNSDVDEHFTKVIIPDVIEQVGNCEVVEQRVSPDYSSDTGGIDTSCDSGPSNND